MHPMHPLLHLAGASTAHEPAPDGLPFGGKGPCQRPKPSPAREVGEFSMCQSICAFSWQLTGLTSRLGACGERTRGRETLDHCHCSGGRLPTGVKPKKNKNKKYPGPVSAARGNISEGCQRTRLMVVRCPITGNNCFSCLGGLDSVRCSVVAWSFRLQTNGGNH